MSRFGQRSRASTAVSGWMPPAPFSPSSLGPAAWYDASDASTLTLSGSSCSQWSDKSGNGQHLIQGTAANQPTSGSVTQNGLNTLTLDGGDFMETASNLSITGATARTIFVVTKSSASGFRAIFTHGTAVAASLVSLLTSSTSTYFVGHYVPDISTTSSIGITLFRLLGYVYDGTTASVRFNGAPASGTNSTAVTLSTSAKLVIGRAIGGSEYWNGSVGEILVYPRALTSAEIALVDSHLNSKWAVY